MKPVPLEKYLVTETTAERHLRRLVSADSTPTILDIGACEGEDSIRYARAFPRGRVYAFEPLPENQALIRANFATYGVTNAELIPIALSDRAGEAEFHISAGEPADKFSGENWNYGNKSSSLLPAAGSTPMHGWIHFPRTIRVACETLDAFCDRHRIATIDFIHMDVQGAEWLVLQGGVRTLPRVRALWLEVAEEELYAGQKLRATLEAFLQRFGFRLVDREQRGVEGDELHINARFWGARRYWISHRLRHAWTRVLRAAGRIRHLALPS